MSRPHVVVIASSALSTWLACAAEPPPKYAFTKPRDYFSASFTEADEKFEQSCAGAGGRFESFPHPLPGDVGEPLRAASCSVGDPAARSVLLTISGEHGIEGFAGSAAQIGALVEADRFALPAGWRAVHVHMINPYGASFVLKENEDNADQYKNFAGLYAAGIDNPVLVEFIDAYNLPALGDPAAQQAAEMALPALIAKYGPEAVGAALVTGQGERPEGIAYFGPDKSWSSATLEAIADAELADVDRIALVNYHTAVGPYGVWTVLSLEEQSQALLAGWLAEAGTPVMPTNVPSGPQPFFEPIRARSGANIVRAVVEAGTYPDTEYQRYFILNLYCRFYGGGWDVAPCSDVREQIREFFYPQDDAWKDQVWNSFGPFMTATLTGLAVWDG